MNYFSFWRKLGRKLKKDSIIFDIHNFRSDLLVQLRIYKLPHYVEFDDFNRNTVQMNFII